MAVRRCYMGPDKIPRLIIAILIGAGGWAPLSRAENVPIEFSFAGYMRAGIGDNDKGGKQACFTNLGSVANEFRLGNECGTYGEASFRALMLHPQSVDDPFFRSQLTLAYFPPNDSQYEDHAVSGVHDINVVEAFVTGGNFDGSRYQLWAGKRFYRMVGINMNDFYYFDNMNGIGGGIEKWKIPSGSLNIAVLRESTFAQPGLPPSGLVQPTQTAVDSSSAGLLGKTALDVRYDHPLTEMLDLSVWVAAAYSPPGSGTQASPQPNTTTPTAPPTYEAGRGFVAGLYSHYKIGPTGFNDFAVVYGTGIMQTLEMGNGYGSRGPAGVVDGSGANNAHRLRIVENASVPITDKFATQIALTYEDRDSGASVDARSTWWNIGLRPYIALSEHTSIVGEIGHSEVRDERDRDASGAALPPRQLTRITIAPQLAVRPDIAARPAIRFFVTHSFWNSANRSFVNGSTVESVSPTLAYTGESSGTSFGVQSEVWF